MAPSRRKTKDAPSFLTPASKKPRVGISAGGRAYQCGLRCESGVEPACGRQAAALQIRLRGLRGG